MIRNHVTILNMCVDSGFQLFIWGRKYFTQRVLNDLKKTRLSCRHMIWLLPNLTQRKTEKETNLLTEVGSGGGGRSPIIRREIAWSSIFYKSFNTLWLNSYFKYASRRLRLQKDMLSNGFFLAGIPSHRSPRVKIRQVFL